MHSSFAVCIAIISVLAAAAAQATPKKPPSVPAREVLSIAQMISASSDPSDIYYPDPEGSAAGYRFPIVVLLQGAFVDKEYYSQFAQGVASYGFVVVVPNHAGLITNMSVITDVLAHMKLEDADSDSPLYGIVNTNMLAVTGHSMGGVAALFSINSYCNFFCDPDVGFERPQELKAVIAYGSSAGPLDIENTGIATAIMAGDLDTGEAFRWATYDTLEYPRAYINIHGANHFGLADIGEPPGATLDPDEEVQSLPQAITATRFAYWTGQFLRAFLFYDWQATWRVMGSGGDSYTTITTDWTNWNRTRRRSPPGRGRPPPLND